MVIGFKSDRQPELEALWCIDSETLEEVLIDLRTSTIIAKRVNGKIVEPGETNVNSRDIR